MSGCQPYTITLSSSHVRRQEGLSTLWRSPPQLLRRMGDVWSLFSVISVAPYPYLLIYSYSGYSTIMECTCDRWIQLVQLQYLYLLFTHAFAVAVVLELSARVYFYLQCMSNRTGMEWAWGLAPLNQPEWAFSSILNPHWHVSLTVPSRYFHPSPLFCL